MAPVWILLQPRDYLSSYLLYGMIALALVGIIGAGIMGNAASLDIPAFTGFAATAGTSKVAASGFLFPALFITIACGAISGFHSLVASGTTSKQLDREAEAQPIAYGGMLLECLVAVISLCAVAFVFSGYMDGTYASPTQVFAAGLSQMLACVPGLAGAESVAYALLVLAVSVFCLTSLDTATRLGRYMFQELFTPHGMEASELTGWRAVLVNPWVATIITVVLGVGLGLTGYQLVWPLFGAANQLLAALGLDVYKRQFLNHQMDIELFSQMAEEWKRLFAGKPINKILTIEASGIGIAAVVAHHFGVPVVFAKKTQSINLDGTMYSTRIQSFTHNRIYDVIVSTRFLGPDDHVLIIDDFLANGCALRGLLEICESAGATVEGIGIAIEKGFQPGGDELREAGYDLQSLAIVEACLLYTSGRLP